MSFSSPITVVKKKPLTTNLRYAASLNAKSGGFQNSPRNLKPIRHDLLHNQWEIDSYHSNHIVQRSQINHLKHQDIRHRQNLVRNEQFNHRNDRSFEIYQQQSSKLMTMSIQSSSSSSSPSVSSTNSTKNANNFTASLFNSSNHKIPFQKPKLSKYTKSSSSNMMPLVRLKKNISRTKEKFLQNIGKTDRTSDESFDLYVENFERQHSQASKLTKELNKYLNCLMETQKASKTFYDTLRDTHEQNWPDHEEFSDQVGTIENKWGDYINKLVNDVQMPLVSYLNEFPELKKKIEKRDNRLLDYDNARHTLEGAQNKTNKKNNTATLLNSSMTGPTASNSLTPTSSSTEQLTKLTKLKIDLEDKQHIYEDINQTLCMALPVLFENRIKFYSSLFQTFFYTETIFHSDCVEIKSKLDGLCENLSTQTAQEISNSEALYYAKINNDSTNGTKKIEQNEQHTNHEITNQENLSSSFHQETSIQKAELTNTEDHQKQHHIQKQALTDQKNEQPSSPQTTAAIVNIKPTEDLKDGSNTPPEYDSNKLESIENFLDKSLKHLELSPILNTESIKHNSELRMSTNLARTESLDIKTPAVASDFIYRVRAAYPYEAKESDEITFVKDDLIEVVEGTESENEDLDEGWLIGVHEVSLKRGLFPANFTKKL